MIPHISNDHTIALFLLLVALLVGLFWWWNRRAKKWLEERGKAERFSGVPHWLGYEPSQKAATRLTYCEEEFREMIERALDEIPEEFDREWKNVAVIVSTDWPSEEDRQRLAIGTDDLLLGTYSGVARTEGSRSESGPHVIVIYQPALEMLCGGDKKRIEGQIRKTVLHELAHHLGMSHERMRKIGL